jgi:hypothetical protein
LELTTGGVPPALRELRDDGTSFPAYPAPASDAFWSGQGEARSRTFTTAGRTYAFRCEQHSYDMRGTVTVTGTATPTPTPTATPSPDPGADAGGGAPPAVRVRTFAGAAASFCVRRGPRCRRPGVRLRIDLTRAARVTGVLRRGTAPARRFGRVAFGTVPAGPRTLTFQRTKGGKRLQAGRYTLAAQIDGAGSRTVRFRVR